MSVPHVFSNPALLELALTHPSMAMGVNNNQRFEFLGDAVLKLVVNEWLLQTRPDWPQGKLSKASAKLVDNQSWAQWADAWELGPMLRLGKGERSRQGPTLAVRADAFEAVVAAIYLDAGLAAVRDVIVPLLNGRSEKLDTLIDPRSFLQEWTQKTKLVAPNYDEWTESGPAHQKAFEVWVAVAGRRFGPGSGRSKASAIAEAARIAIAGLGLALADD